MNVLKTLLPEVAPLTTRENKQTAVKGRGNGSLNYTKEDEV